MRFTWALVINIQHLAAHSGRGAPFRPSYLATGYAAPYRTAARAGTAPLHTMWRASAELAGIDCFYIGRLYGTNGALWQLSGIDVCFSTQWAKLVICPTTIR